MVFRDGFLKRERQGNLEDEPFRAVSQLPCRPFFNRIMLSLSTNLEWLAALCQGSSAEHRGRPLTELNGQSPRIAHHHEVCAVGEVFVFEQGCPGSEQP